jgi:1,4-alpha-glucan branching enzyme
MNQVQVHSLFTDFDINLFKAGKHFKLYEKLGAHLTEVNGVKGVYFAVWAPAARSVSVVGDFNYWIQGEHHFECALGWFGNLGRIYSGC